MPVQNMDAMAMLRDIAAKQVDEATEALAKAMKVFEEAKSKYELLLEYRQDYVKNLNQSLAIGMGAETYQNFQSFFNKLDQAVNGQVELVKLADHQLKIQKQLWQESQRKKLSYQVLLKRSDKRVEKLAIKQDQKAMDEFAMRTSRTANKSLRK
jgi:flagellar protein FliJ